MNHLPASKARDHLAEILNKVTFGAERIILSRRGKDLAAVIPIADSMIPLLRSISNVNRFAGKNTIKNQ